MENNRLLTPEYIRKKLGFRVYNFSEILSIRQEQDASSYAAGLAEGRTKAAHEIFPIIDKLYEILSHADFSNGVEAEGMDEGRVRSGELIFKLRKQYLALKSQFGEQP
jgi:hypothetical protein